MAKILFLMLTISIVAHTVIPHQHHNNMICLESSHHPNDNNSHQHDSDDNDHHHDDKNDIKSCILYQFVPNQNNHTQNICKSLNYKNNFPILLFKILFSEINNRTSKTLEFSYFPIIQSEYSVFVSECLGLRAPPVI